MKRATIAVDGASKGNPGPAGIGVVICDESGNALKEISEHIGIATNNAAEYRALIRGLTEAYDMGFTDIEVTTDSELMAKQINGQYRVKTETIVPLFQSVIQIMGKFKNVSIQHVTRDKNKLADKLASKAASGKEEKEKAQKTEPEKPKMPSGKGVQTSLMLEETAKEIKEKAMIQRLNVRTSSRSQMLDITRQVQDVVKTSGVSDGVCSVFIPHTTAGITINENADPDVPHDIIDTLNRLIPQDASYRHAEGNADSHVKASLMGFSVNVLVENGRLILGTWQGIFFCEFDGPRNRQVYVRVG